MSTNARAPEIAGGRAARRTALITGCDGFVGRHLVEATRAAGYTVVGLDRVGADAVDLLDAPRVREVVARAAPEIVFHLAGLLRSDEPRALYDVNIGGTVNLLEALLRAERAPTIVVASSSAVYGITSQPPLTENSALAPLSHYGASKVGQEAAALRFHTAHALRIMVARTFNVVGPGQPATLAAGSFARQVARAERAMPRELRAGDLSGTRDFVDVRDVALAYLAIADRGVSGRAYNVCSGLETPVRGCVESLLARATVPIELVPVPAAASPVVVPAQVGSARLLSIDTGWSAKTEFATSMADLLDWWRARVAEGQDGET